MSRKTFNVFAVFLSILFFSTPVFANLAAVGPINEANGFPLWYQDTNGVVLDLPTPPIGDGGLSDLVIPTQIFDPIDPANAFSQQIGFGSEASYFDANARMDVNSGDPASPGRAELIMALEAGFLNEVAVDGEQVVFTRLRIRVDIPPTGAGQTYKVSHPYGIQTFTNVAAGPRGINSTIDTGLTPLNFSLALDGQIGPFLAQDPPPPVDPVSGSWIGDGVTVGPVTGSPRGFNIFRIEGPDIGGPGVNTVETNLFVVSGHVFAGVGPGPAPPPLPLTADRITYSRTAKNTTIEIFASSAIGATVKATIPGVANPVTLAPGVSALNGSFFRRVTVANPFELPASITLDATLGDQTNQIVTGPPTDVITILGAEFVTKSRRVRIEVGSSDLTGNPSYTLIAPVIRSFKQGKVVFNMPPNIPVAEVTVQSSAGGVATLPVTLK